MWLTIVQGVVHLWNLCSCFPCKKIIQAWWLLSYTLIYYIVSWNLGDREMRNLLHVNHCILHPLCPRSTHFPWLFGGRKPSPQLMHPTTPTSSKPNTSRYSRNPWVTWLWGWRADKSTQTVKLSPTVLPFPITSGFSGTRRSDAHAQSVARVVIPVGCFQLARYILDMWHSHGDFCPSGRTPWLFGRPATVSASDT